MLAEAFLHATGATTRLGKVEDGTTISDYDEAIRLAPKYANGYAHRGDALRSKGQSDRAVTDLEEALRLEGYEPDTIPLDELRRRLEG